MELKIKHEIRMGYNIYEDLSKYMSVEKELEIVEAKLIAAKKFHQEVSKLEFPVEKFREYKKALNYELEIRNNLKTAVTKYYEKAYSENPDYNVVRESYFSVINFFPALKGFNMGHVKQSKYKYNLDQKTEDEDFIKAKKLEKKFIEAQKQTIEIHNEIYGILHYKTYSRDFPPIRTPDLSEILTQTVIRDEGKWFHPEFYNDYREVESDLDKEIEKRGNTNLSRKKFEMVDETMDQLHVSYRISEEFKQRVSKINKLDEKKEQKIFNKFIKELINDIHELHVVSLLKRRKYLKDRHLHDLRIKKHETTDGFIYILTNKAFPKFIKIGSTMKDPKIRAHELTGTGVPFPYEVKFKILTKNCEILEKKVHSILLKKRVDIEREFFECSVEEAKKIIEKVIKNEIKS